MNKKAQIVLGILGLGLLAWMIHRAGAQTLWANLSAFGFRWMAALIALYGMAQWSFCMAWHVLLKAGPNPILFRDAFWAYLAGDAVNMTVPSANLAGEPVKIMMLRGKIPVETAVTSVTVYKYADFLSMTLFLAFGWAFHFAFYSFPLAWNIGGGLVVFGMTMASILIFWLQKKGFYHPTGKWLQKIKPLEELIEKKLASAHLVDQGIRDFYVHHPRRFFLSVFFNFLAWCGGVLEIVLFMTLLGVPVSIPAALAIEIFSLFINNVVFFVPARIGVIEGGRVLLFLATGYSVQAGMSYGIIRRMRELAWIGIGFLVLMLARRKSTSGIPTEIPTPDK